MQTKLTVEITGKTAAWIVAAAAKEGWRPNQLLAHILDQADQVNRRGLLVHDGAEIPAIAGYDVQTVVEISFEVGEMVNVEYDDTEAWLLGMVLGVGQLGVEVQLTKESAESYDGPSRDLWSPESLHAVK